MIESSCHCGALKLKIDGELPATFTSCNCSYCSRAGSLMAYYNPQKVTVIAAEGASIRYITGDKTLAFVICKTCGNFSHWVSIDPNQTDRMGINARLFTNVDISKTKIRHFDGATTWKFLD